MVALASILFLSLPLTPLVYHSPFHDGLCAGARLARPWCVCVDFLIPLFSATPTLPSPSLLLPGVIK